MPEAIGWLVYGDRLTIADAIGTVTIVVAVLRMRDSAEPMPPPEPALNPAA